MMQSMTKPFAYYNENDPQMAAWLRELIRHGLIATGIVDERSIEDVVPDELAAFTQCHFFAGIGIWSYALRQAGFPDDRPVWTGSTPCQPFSAAGKGGGFADERHLWPAFYHLISQCRPRVVFGEQVESKDGRTWLDLVQADMEAAGYAFGPVVLPAAGFGAPHGRHRVFFVGSLADTSGGGWDGRAPVERWIAQWRMSIAGAGEAGRVGHPGGTRLEGRGIGRDGPDERASREAGVVEQPTAGFWADAEWLPCRDNKWRPVKPRIFPLAHGDSFALGGRRNGRAALLKGAGNAIVAEVAKEFVAAYLDTPVSPE
jgi:DNA (cytosine-5)-methyltransferase 1